MTGGQSALWQGAKPKPSWTALLVVVLIAYLRWLAPDVAPYAGASDSAGYLWSARLFRHLTLSMPIVAPPGFPRDLVGALAFVPGGGRLKDRARIVPTYPTGFPLHLAAVELAVGEEAAVRATLLASIAGALVLLYLLGREAGLGRGWAAAACLLFGLSPLVLFLAVQPFSDVLATLWAEAAVLCAWRARSRGSSYATLAGASLGVATLVRPTNLLLLLPVAAALPATIGAYAALIAGGLPFACFVSVYQWWAYGHPLASGYGNVLSAFSLANVVPSLRHFGLWLPRLASWLVLLAPVAAHAWRGPLARWRLVALAWILGVFGTYALYALTSETWWNLRFVLPAFPPLVIAAVVGLQELTRVVTERWTPSAAVRWGAPALAAIGVGACAAALVGQPEFAAWRAVKPSESMYRDALKFMAVQQWPPGPILMQQMTGASIYYAPGLRFLRMDEMRPDRWAAIRQWQSRAHVAVGAALSPAEQEQLDPLGRPWLPCAWQSRGHYRQITLWECPASP